MYVYVCVCVCVCWYMCVCGCVSGVCAWKAHINQVMTRWFKHAALLGMNCFHSSISTSSLQSHWSFSKPYLKVNNISPNVIHLQATEVAHASHSHSFGTQCCPHSGSTPQLLWQVPETHTHGLRQEATIRF